MDENNNNTDRLVQGMETEERIRYDDLTIKYNPQNEQQSPWELWTDGEFQLAAATPRDVMGAWIATNDTDGRYTDKEGIPRHEVEPDAFEGCEEEVLVHPAMEVDVVPSREVQTAIWEALKEDVEDVLHLDEYCEDNDLPLKEAKRAIALFAGDGLVEWGVSIRVPWLTADGKETVRPAWFGEWK